MKENEQFNATSCQGIEHEVVSSLLRWVKMGIVLHQLVSVLLSFFNSSTKRLLSWTLKIYTYFISVVHSKLFYIWLVKIPSLVQGWVIEIL